MLTDQMKVSRMSSIKQKSIKIFVDGIKVRLRNRISISTAKKPFDHSSTLRKFQLKFHRPRDFKHFTSHLKH